MTAVTEIERPSMRLSKEELKQITGKEQSAAQVRWFRQHYGVQLAHDRNGVILTKSAFNGLVEKQCGLMPANQNAARPAVRLVQQKAA